MNSVRKRQIEEAIKRTLGMALLKSPHQPDLAKISITAVEVNADVSLARVYFCPLVNLTREAAEEALAVAHKFLRNYLAKHLNLRSTPELSFRFDESLERARKITDLIDTALKTTVMGE